MCLLDNVTLMSQIFFSYFHCKAWDSNDLPKAIILLIADVTTAWESTCRKAEKQGHATAETTHYPRFSRVPEVHSYCARMSAQNKQS